MPAKVGASTRKKEKCRGDVRSAQEDKTGKRILQLRNLKVDNPAWRVVQSVI